MRLKAVPQLAVPALSQRVSDGSTKVRELAVEALGNYGKAAQSAVPMLLGCLTETNKTLRGLAAWALVQVDLRAARESPLVAPALTENLQHETWWLPKFCGEALKLINSDEAPEARVK